MYGTPGDPSQPLAIVLKKHSQLNAGENNARSTSSIRMTTSALSQTKLTVNALY